MKQRAQQKTSSGKTKAKAKALAAPKPSKAAKPAAVEAEAPAIASACEGLVELCLQDGAFDELTRGYKREAFEGIAAEYEKLQQGAAHVDALSELIGLSGYFQNLGYAHGAEQLKALALTSAPLLEKQRKSGWSR